MKLRKQNSSQWYAMGLALMLTFGALAASTGTALARYRAETEVVIPFTVRSPEKVYLGIWENPEGQTEAVFTQKNISSWTVAGDENTLAFVAANGTGAGDFRENDQQIRVRLIGSVGLYDQTIGTAPEITLKVPETVTVKAEDPQQTTEAVEETQQTTTQQVTYKATATPIRADSALYKTFGQGWIFTFHETQEVTVGETTQTVPGEELSWTLKGGQFSTLDMTLAIDNANLSVQSILKLQVTGE